MDMQTALNRLENITGFKPIKIGKGNYMAICPSHDDNNPSLSVTYKPAQDQKHEFTLNCFSGCLFKDIMLSLDTNIPQPKRLEKEYNKTPFWKLPVVKTYTYYNALGKKSYQKVRFEPKTFAIRHWARGRFKWGLGNNEPLLYNLPNVITADLVFIVEGEKNADALIDLGLVATCNFDGAGKWLSQYQAYLINKKVRIIPDNDVAGLAHAQLVYDQVSKVADTKIITLPGLAVKQDLFDWLLLGNTRSDLLNLI